MEVSHHSLLRWRERASTYGDENSEAILSKIQKAIEKQGKPQRGFSFYEVDGVRFLVENNGRRSEIVTVIKDNGLKDEIQTTVSKKQARLKRLGIKTHDQRIDKESIQPKYIIDDTIKKYQEILNSIEDAENKRSWLKSGVQQIAKLPTRAERNKYLNLLWWLESELRSLKKSTIEEINGTNNRQKNE